MRISDLLSMCARNLTRRKFRTFLTVMGVVIGTSFIVMMISLGLGIEQTQMQILENWGDLTLITIQNAGNTETVLDDAAIAAIAAMPQVETATPVADLRIDGASIMLQAGRRQRYEMFAWSIVALYPGALEPLGYSVIEGELLSTGEGGRTIRVMFGEQTAYEFTDTRRHWTNNRINIWNVPEGEPIPDPFFDPLTEQNMRLTVSPWDADGRSVEFDVEVVGIMEGDWRRGWETFQGVVMSLEDMQHIVQEYNRVNNIRRERGAVDGYDTARIRCYSIDGVAEVEAAIRAMGFPNTFSMEQERQTAQEGARQIQMILGFIGGIALFIASLSIMNTMIMSVYERTREIGVMKVLGCGLGNIRSVFLIEAALIGFFGGVIGNMLSILASFLLNTYGGGLGGGLGGMGGGMGGGMVIDAPISVIPPWLMLLGMVFATCVGLVSGIIPAMRAVKISALEAIRTE